MSSFPCSHLWRIPTLSDQDDEVHGGKHSLYIQCNTRQTDTNLIGGNFLSEASCNQISNFKGIGVVRGDQLVVRECYGFSTCGKGNTAAQSLVLVANAKKADAKVGKRKVEDFDPRVGDVMADIQPIKDPNVIYLEQNYQSKTIQIRKGLTEEYR